jgi:glycosyltransferase involved in cell wall biosynthesis
MKNILVVIDSLQIGGITSSYKSLLNQLLKFEGYSVYSQVLNNQKININGITQIWTCSLVKVLYIGRSELNKEKLLIKFIFYFSRALKFLFGEYFTKKIIFSTINHKKFDIVISFCNDIYIKQRRSLLTNMYVDISINSTKKIAWIHADPRDIGLNDSIASKIYNKYNNVICVSDEQKKNVDNLCNSIHLKTSTIKNFIDCSSIMVKSNEYAIDMEKTKINLLTIARIEFETKAINRVIEISIKLLSGDFNNFSWYIVGSGKDFVHMKTLVRQHNLENYLFLEGEKSNPYPYMKNADLFVLPSRYEAYPVVILEAQCMSLPSIVTNYPSAIEQIINGFNGYIADNNSDDLYKKIIFVIQNKLHNLMKKNLKDSNYQNDANSILNLSNILEED